MSNGTDPRGARAPRPNKILAAPATPAVCAGDLRRNDPGDPNGRQAAAAQSRNQFARARMSAAN
ncbi:hypothetical protein AB0958_18880 [Streptomyces sp. NPDC006655]|uniref:hypothetical protein n=1 Tax=Streptomyces sp. NPDC006655 TaxID=3156898 RepID=UPI00345390BF